MLRKLLCDIPRGLQSQQAATRGPVGEQPGLRQAPHACTRALPQSTFAFLGCEFPSRSIAGRAAAIPDSLPERFQFSWDWLFAHAIQRMASAPEFNFYFFRIYVKGLAAK